MSQVNVKGRNLAEQTLLGMLSFDSCLIDGNLYELLHSLNILVYVQNSISFHAPTYRGIPGTRLNAGS